jgi:endonuclease/exonuclease/phosphatase family metal-dependent hydrolase
MPNGVLGEIGSPASVDVAVLSKREIDDVVRYRALHPLTLPGGAVTTFSRDLLEVHTRAANGAEIVMFAAHFKATVNDEPERRLAEAQVSSEIVNAVASARPGVLVVLGGDLNDTPGSPPLNALRPSIICSWHRALPGCACRSPRRSGATDAVGAVATTPR